MKKEISIISPIMFFKLFLYINIYKYINASNYYKVTAG